MDQAMPSGSMTPDEMGELQKQSGGPQEGGVLKLAKQTGQGLAQLAEMLNSAPGVTDQDKEQMAGILNGFIDLVEKKLGQAPGEDAAEESTDMSQVPVAQGRTGVPGGPQSRM